MHRKRAALERVLWIVLALLLLALAFLVGGLIRGNFGPWKTTAQSAAPTRQQVQAEILADVPKRVSGVANVTCVMPTAWTPGDTFTCYAYGSSNHELAQMAGTVLPDNGDHWEVNELWTSLP